MDKTPFVIINHSPESARIILDAMEECARNMSKEYSGPSIPMDLVYSDGVERDELGRPFSEYPEEIREQCRNRSPF